MPNLPARQRIANSLVRAAQYLTGVSSWSSGWWSSYSGPFGPITEGYAGAWQHNITFDRPTLLASSAVFACVTGISGDIAKLRIKLVSDEDRDGIWSEVENPAYSPVLRKPNHYQTRIQFIQSWVVSKLLYGNAYILKERDNRRVVTALYPLHPLCVTPLVSEDGAIYYKVKRDYLSGIQDETDATFPASEIIHDRMCELWHPLVGVSPLFACSAAATMQTKIMNSSMSLFGNRSIPGGILTAPGAISNETAARLKADWESNFGGNNFGRTAVLGDGLEFKSIAETAEHAQLAEQLGFTVEDVARAFHYPRFKLTGEYPTYDSIQSLNVMYYSDCLQEIIEKLEMCLDEGLSMPVDLGVEFDLDNLLRMDTAALYESINNAGKWMTINEQRKRANYTPLPKGGDTVYRQEQDHSIESIVERDESENPFGTKKPEPTPEPESNEPEPEEEARSFDANDLEIFEGELVLR